MEFNSISDVKDFYQKVGRLASSCSVYYISVSKSRSDNKVFQTFHLKERPINSSDRVVLSASSLEEIYGKLEAMLKATKVAMAADLLESSDKFMETEYFPKFPPTTESEPLTDRQ
jgi:hypothetical protein